MVLARERWLSLALVVDTGPAMAVWRPLVSELREAMFRLGAFRDVRVWLLTADGGAHTGIAVRASAGGPALAPSALVDPTGRQAVAVLSDCSGRHWWDGRAGAAVHQWARQGPTAILQPLGEDLWRRTAAPTVPGQAILSRPGAPNTELRFTPHDSPVRQRLGSIAIPVTELSADWLADWARLVTATGGPRDTAVTYVSGRVRAAVEPLTMEEELPPADRVRRFQAAASREAAELAAHVALAVPYLPVMRLIQHRVIRSSEPSDLAQVLLSGLLRPIDGVPGLYDFVPGARDALLRTLPRAKSLATAAVLERISAEIQERAGTAANTFRAVMNVAEGTGRLSAGAADRPFALVNADALRMLSHTATPVSDRAPSAEAVQPSAAEVAPTGPSPDPSELTSAVVYTGHRGNLDFVLRLPPRIPETDWPTSDELAFPGRNTELTNVLDALDPVRPRQVPILIEGEEGTGKTALAMRSARTALARGWFPGGFLSVRLGASADVGELVTQLLDDLRIPDGYFPASAEERIELYRGILAAYATQNRRILVVIDDAVDSAQVRPLLPADGRTGTIIASRQHLEIEPAHAIRLEGRDEPVFVPAPDLPPGPRTALIIATEQYQDPALRDLPAAVRDAEELADVLADPAIGGFTVKRLFNQPASRIQREIASFLSGRRPDETALLYLSCHILQDAPGRTLFAAADTKAQFPVGTAIEASMLAGELNECAARRQIIIIDYASVPITEEVPRSDPGPLLASNRSGREVLTFSRDLLYYSIGDTPGITRPTTTAAMVEGLRTGAADADRDGRITVAEAYRYAFGHVRSTGDQEPPKRRWSGEEGSSTVLARSPAGRAVVPAMLPEPVTEALRSSYPEVRIGAVNEIAQWLTDSDPARALAARRALEQVAETDIARVTEVAAAHLRWAEDPAESAPAQPATVRLARRGGSRSPLTSTILGQDRDQALCVAFSPDGRLLASGGRRGRVHVHDVAAGDQVLALETGEDLVNNVAFSPDGRLLATAGGGEAVRLWETLTGRVVGRMDAGRGAIVRAVAFSPDGTLAAGYEDGAVRIWSAATGEQQPLPGTFAAPVTDLAFSLGGSFLAASDDGMVRVWGATVGERTTTITRHDTWVMGTAFSPDGTLLASGGEDGRLNFYDVATGELVRSEYAGRDRVSCVAFSWDGALLAAGREHGTIEIWRVATGERQALLEGHTEAVYDVAFSPAEPLLIASAGNDGTVRLWRPAASGNRVSS
jgi:WD40 repeat protein